jgi:hypothetical protein
MDDRVRPPAAGNLTGFKTNAAKLFMPIQVDTPAAIECTKDPPTF